MSNNQMKVRTETQDAISDLRIALMEAVHEETNLGHVTFMTDKKFETFFINSVTNIMQDIFENMKKENIDNG